MAKKTKKENQNLSHPNLQIMNITYLFLLIFLSMVAYYIHFQLKESDEIINNAYNKREEILSDSVIRGKILSDQGDVLAETVTDEEGNESRYYPYGNLFSHSVGYSTHGQTGVELLANYKLLTSNAPLAEIASDDIKGIKHLGDNVCTSLNLSLTRTAYEALGDHRGAVIAMDPSNGQILTMISKPDFDPNQIAEVYDEIISDENNSNLLNRTVNGLYTPGSTFKFFTLYEYLKEHPDYENYSYECNGSISVGDYHVQCSNGRSHGEEDLILSFANSCNSSFVNLGLTLDKKLFKKNCEALYFNRPLPVSYPYQESQFVLDSHSNDFDTMQTVIGQGKTLVSPMHLLLIASALANKGVLYRPYLITRVENHYGTVMKTYEPEIVTELFQPEETEVLNRFMRAVVEQGTASKLQSDQYEAYGKTGTAQIEDGSHNNSLFMGFAKNSEKTIAICVVMEDPSEGSIPSVPVAKAVLDNYFSR